MCWQTIGLKDPTSQELLEGVERERSIRVNHARTAAIFHHPALADFEFQHLPVGGSDAELEERIIQHLAAAAARGRAHHIARRGWVRSGYQGRPQYLVYSTNQNSPSVGFEPTSPALGGENESPPAVVAVNPSISTISPGRESTEVTSDLQAQVNQTPLSTSRDSDNTNRPSISTPRPLGCSVNQDRAGPSELQSLSDTLRSRWNVVSMRYKESIARNTRGWRERLFSRNSSVADIGSEVRREVSAGIANMSRMVERLDTRESRTTNSAVSPGAEVNAVVEPRNEGVTGSQANTCVNSSTSSTSCAATSGSN
ncbi:E3 ubiquitin-protein ligase RHF2A-like isoform X2 [Curcuma longa]